MEKNQKVLIVFLVALVIVLTGATIYFAVSKYTCVPSASQSLPAQKESLAGKIPSSQEQTPIQSQTPTTNSNPKIKSLDGKWNLYTNEELGFSIKVPKEICTFSTEGKITNCPENYTEPFGVFEKENNKVYLGTACEENDCSNDWIITVAKAENDQDVIKFIKEITANQCDKFTQIGDRQLGVSLINITTDGKQCVLPFGYYLWYGYGKIAYLPIGQGPNFPLSPVNNEPFAKNEFADQEMIMSFRLLEE